MTKILHVSVYVQSHITKTFQIAFFYKDNTNLKVSHSVFMKNGTINYKKIIESLNILTCTYSTLSLEMCVPKVKYNMRNLWL